MFFKHQINLERERDRNKNKAAVVNKLNRIISSLFEQTIKISTHFIIATSIVLVPFKREVLFSQSIMLLSHFSAVTTLH